MNKGLGDIVEAAIKRATFGKVRPKKDCGCEKRKQWLNRNVPYGNDFYSSMNVLWKKRKI